MSKKKMGWRELPFGDSIKSGTAQDFETGDWRSQKPVWNEEKCIHCMRCWINCPDSSILVKDGKVTGIDYKYCKGCAICSYECPTKPEKAIKMEPER